MILFQRNSHSVRFQTAGNSSAPNAMPMRAALQIARRVFGAIAVGLLLWGFSPATQASGLSDFTTACSGCHGAAPNGPNFDAAGSTTIITEANSRGMGAGNAALWPSVVTYIDSIKPTITNLAVPYRATGAAGTGTVVQVPDIYLNSTYAGINAVATVGGPGKGTVSYSAGVLHYNNATYTPAAGQCGADSWTYQGTGTGSSTTTRTATVLIANPSLGANSFSTSIAYSTSPTTIPLSLTGDGPTSVTVVSVTGAGSAAASGTNAVTYTASSVSYSSTVSIVYHTNACGQVSLDRTITVNVGAPPGPVFTTPATNPASAPAGQTGVAYSYTVVASSSNTAPTYAFSTGALPTGLSLSSGGVISGTPTVVGAFSATVTATNLNPAPTSQILNFNITLGPPVITSSASATGTVGAVYTAGSPLYQIVATNSPTLFGALDPLPSGLTLNTSTGAVTGTPVANGSTAVRLTAQNATATAQQTVNFSISTIAPVVTSLGPANGQTGVAFSFQITAANAPTSFNATALPAGLTVNTTTGLISGTPTAVGTTSVTVTASNASGTSPAQAVSFVITLGPPVITSAATASGAVGIVFGGYQITATNSPTSFTASGLPGGLSLNASTGLISGTPTASGSFVATLGALNGTLPNGSQSVTFNIAVGIPAISSATTASGQSGVPFSYQIVASNSPASYGASGLPTGLSVNTATGLISGTTFLTGTFSATITATNGTGTGSQPLTISTTLGPPVINSATTASAVVTQAFSYQITAANAPTSFGASGLPGGLTVNTSTGLVSGIPTQNGSFTATVSAANAIGSGTQTLVITSVNPPAPAVAARSATVAFNMATPIDLTTAVSGQFSSIAVSTPPTKGRTTVSGNIVTYTPTTGYFGADSFAYTATGLGGTSAPATVSITVSTLAPTAGAATLTAQLNIATTLDLIAFIQGSAISGVVIGTPPTHGTATVNGTKVTYTPASNYFGADAFTYSAFGNAGTSAPATVSVTVIGRPDPTRDAAVLGLLAAQVDTAQRFSRAQMSNVQGRLEFLHRTDDRGGSNTNTGTARAGENRTAASASPAATNAGRSGSKSLERGSQLDGSAPTAASSNSFLQNSYAMAGNGLPDTPGLRPTVAPFPFASSAVSLLTTGSFNVASLAGDVTGGGTPSSAGIATNFWLGGVANFGTRNASGGRSGLDFTTNGISLGLDRRFSDEWVLGMAAGFASDRSNIGNDGSHSRAHGYSAMVYASYQPSAKTFVDGLIGAGSLDFKTQRYVAPINDFAHGDRRGYQLFGSLSAGYEYRDNGVLISPYTRIDYSADRLNQSTETGAGLYALTYFSQTTPSLQGALGLRAETLNRTSFGWASPRVRTEYRHDFQGNRDISLAYADLASGPRYTVSTGPTVRNSLVLGIGSDFVRRGGLTIAVDYQYLHSFSRDNNQSIRVLFSQDLDGRGSPFWENAFIIAPTKPEDIQVDAGFTFDSNVTRAKDSVDKLPDRSYSVNIGKGMVFPMTEHARNVLTGTLGAENFQTYNALSRVSAGLQGEFQYRDSAEFDAPTWALTAQGTAEDYRSKLRSGSRYSIAASVRQPITDRITVFAALVHNERYAKSTVFNNRNNALRLNIDYAYSASDTIYLSGEYRRGQIISSGHASLGNLAVADVLVQDDAFPGGQYFTYRFNGTTVLSTLGYNIGFGPRHSLDLSWRRAQSTPNSQPNFATPRLNYIADQYSIVYLVRF